MTRCAASIDFLVIRGSVPLPSARPHPPASDGPPAPLEEGSNAEFFDAPQGPTETKPSVFPMKAPRGACEYDCLSRR